MLSKPGLYFSSFLKKQIATLLALSLLFMSAAPQFALAGLWGERRRSVGKEREKTEAGRGILAAPSSNSPALPGRAEGTARLAIPSEIGSVVESFLPENPNSDLPLVIHIQDAHGYVESQRNLARLLKLVKGFDASALLRRASPAEGPSKPLLVCAEGAWGDVGLEWLHVFPDTALRAELAEELLKSAKITGEEYLGILEGRESLRVAGVEEERVYRANVRAREMMDAAGKKILSSGKKGSVRIRAVAQELRGLKEKFYPERLLALERKRFEYGRGRLSLSDYLTSLRASVAPADWERLAPAALRAFTELLDREKEIRRQALSLERDDFVKRLEQSADEADLKALAEEGLRFRLGQTDDLSFYSRILALAERLAVSLPETERYVRYLEQANRTPMHEVNEAIAGAEEAIFEHLAQGGVAGPAGLSRWDPRQGDAQAEKLVRLSRWVDLEEKLWASEMSPAERMSHDALRKSTGWQDVENFLASAASPASFERGGWRNFSAVIEKSRPAADEYYRRVEERNRILVENTLEQARRAEAGKVALIAGGYHTPGITAILREKQCPFIVVRPALGDGRLVRRDDHVQQAIAGIFTLRLASAFLSSAFWLEFAGTLFARAVRRLGPEKFLALHGAYVESLKKLQPTLGDRQAAEQVEKLIENIDGHLYYAPAFKDADGTEYTLLSLRTGKAQAYLLFAFKDGAVRSYYNDEIVKDAELNLPGREFTVPEGWGLRNVKTGKLQNATGGSLEIVLSPGRTAGTQTMHLAQAQLPERLLPKSAQNAPRSPVQISPRAGLGNVRLQVTSPFRTLTPSSRALMGVFAVAYVVLLHFYPAASGLILFSTMFLPGIFGGRSEDFNSCLSIIPAQLKELIEILQNRADWDVRNRAEAEKGSGELLGDAQNIFGYSMELPNFRSVYVDAFWHDNPADLSNLWALWRSTYRNARSGSRAAVLQDAIVLRFWEKLVTETTDELLRTRREIERFTSLHEGAVQHGQGETAFYGQVSTNGARERALTKVLNLLNEHPSSWVNTLLSGRYMQKNLSEPQLKHVERFLNSVLFDSFRGEISFKQVIQEISSWRGPSDSSEGAISARGQAKAASFLLHPVTLAFLSLLFGGIAFYAGESLPEFTRSVLTGLSAVLPAAVGYLFKVIAGILRPIEIRAGPKKLKEIPAARFIPGRFPFGGAVVVDVPSQKAFNKLPLPQKIVSRHLAVNLHEFLHWATNSTNETLVLILQGAFYFGGLGGLVLLVTGFWIPGSLLLSGFALLLALAAKLPPRILSGQFIDGEIKLTVSDPAVFKGRVLKLSPQPGDSDDLLRAIFTAGMLKDYGAQVELDLSAISGAYQADVNAQANGEVLSETLQQLSSGVETPEAPSSRIAAPDVVLYGSEHYAGQGKAIARRFNVQAHAVGRAETETGLPRVRLPEGVSLAGKNVTLVSPGRTNGDILRLILTVGLLKKNGAAQVTIVEPYLGYSRQHTFLVNKEAYGANSTKILFDALNGFRSGSFEVRALISNTVHFYREEEPEIERAYPPVKGNNYQSPLELVSLNPLEEVARHLVRKVREQKKIGPLLFLADKGSIQAVTKVVDVIAEELRREKITWEIALIPKERIGETEVKFGDIYKLDGTERKLLKGDLSGYNVVVLDDELRTGTTLEELVTILNGRAGGFQNEAGGLYVGVVHAVAAYPGDVFREKLPALTQLIEAKHLVSANTIPPSAALPIEQVSLDDWTAREMQELVASHLQHSQLAVASTARQSHERRLYELLSHNEGLSVIMLHEPETDAMISDPVFMGRLLSELGDNYSVAFGKPFTMSADNVMGRWGVSFHYPMRLMSESHNFSAEFLEKGEKVVQQSDGERFGKWIEEAYTLDPTNRGIRRLRYFWNTLAGQKGMYCLLIRRTDRLEILKDMGFILPQAIGEKELTSDDVDYDAMERCGLERIDPLSLDEQSFTNIFIKGHTRTSQKPHAGSLRRVIVDALDDEGILHHLVQGAMELNVGSKGAAFKNEMRVSQMLTMAHSPDSLPDLQREVQLMSDDDLQAFTDQIMTHTGQVLRGKEDVSFGSESGRPSAVGGETSVIDFLHRLWLVTLAMMPSVLNRWLIRMSPNKFSSDKDWVVRSLAQHVYGTAVVKSGVNRGESATFPDSIGPLGIVFSPDKGVGELVAIAKGIVAAGKMMERKNRTKSPVYIVDRAVVSNLVRTFEEKRIDDGILYVDPLYLPECFGFTASDLIALRQRMIRKGLLHTVKGKERNAAMHEIALQGALNDFGHVLDIARRSNTLVLMHEFGALLHYAREKNIEVRYLLRRGDAWDVYRLKIAEYLGLAAASTTDEIGNAHLSPLSYRGQAFPREGGEIEAGRTMDREYDVVADSVHLQVEIDREMEQLEGNSRGLRDAGIEDIDVRLSKLIFQISLLPDSGQEIGYLNRVLAVVEQEGLIGRVVRYTSIYSYLNEMVNSLIDIDAVFGRAPGKQNRLSPMLLLYLRITFPFNYQTAVDYYRSQRIKLLKLSGRERFRYAENGAERLFEINADNIFLYLEPILEGIRRENPDCVVLVDAGARPLYSAIEEYVKENGLRTRIMLLPASFYDSLDSKEEITERIELGKMFVDSRGNINQFFANANLQRNAGKVFHGMSDSELLQVARFYAQFVDNDGRPRTAIIIDDNAVSGRTFDRLEGILSQHGYQCKKAAVVVYGSQKEVHRKLDYYTAIIPGPYKWLDWPAKIGHFLKGDISGKDIRGVSTRVKGEHLVRERISLGAVRFNRAVRKAIRRAVSQKASIFDPILRRLLLRPGHSRGAEVTYDIYTYGVAPLWETLLFQKLLHGVISGGLMSCGVDKNIAILLSAIFVGFVFSFSHLIVRWLVRTDDGSGDRVGDFFAFEFTSVLLTFVVESLGPAPAILIHAIINLLSNARRERVVDNKRSLLDVFNDPQHYRDEILKKIKIRALVPYVGGANLYWFPTKFCPVGCDFCFFKSHYGIQRTRENVFDQTGVAKLVELERDSGAQLMTVAGGGDPFLEVDTLEKYLRETHSKSVVLVTSGFWAKNQKHAEEIVDRLYRAVRSRENPIEVYIRLSVDDFHVRRISFEPAINLVGLFEKKYAHEEGFGFFIHGLEGDPTIGMLQDRLGGKRIEKVDSRTAQSVIESGKKVDYVIRLESGYDVPIREVRVFHADANVDLRKPEIVKRNLSAWSEKNISKSMRPDGRVVYGAYTVPGTPVEGTDWLIGYDGTIELWSSSPPDAVGNIYEDNFETIRERALNDILTLAMVEKGAQYVESIIKEVNPAAVVRAQAVNIPDWYARILFEESRTRLYASIRILQDYLHEGRFNPDEVSAWPANVQKLLALSKGDLRDAYRSSEYSIVHQILDGYRNEKDVPIEKLVTLFDRVCKDHYDVSVGEMLRIVRESDALTSKQKAQFFSVVLTSDFGIGPVLSEEVVTSLSGAVNPKTVIIFSGEHGAGKSTAAEILARQSGLKFISKGKLMRQAAAKYGFDDIVDFINYLGAEGHEEEKKMVNKAINAKLIEAISHGGVIIDDNYASNLIETLKLDEGVQVYKVWVELPIAIRAERVFSNPRPGDKKFATLSEASDYLLQRDELERRNYLKKTDGQYDFMKSQYDLGIITADKTAEEVAEEVLGFVVGHQTASETAFNPILSILKKNIREFSAFDRNVRMRDADRIEQLLLRVAAHSSPLRDIVSGFDYLLPVGFGNSRIKYTIYDVTGLRFGVRVVDQSYKDDLKVLGSLVYGGKRYEFIDYLELLKARDDVDNQLSYDFYYEFSEKSYMESIINQTPIETNHRDASGRRRRLLVLGVLGRGDEGVVYWVKDADTNARFALKVGRVRLDDAYEQWNAQYEKIAALGDEEATSLFVKYHSFDESGNSILMDYVPNTRTFKELFVAGLPDVQYDIQRPVRIIEKIARVAGKLERNGIYLGEISILNVLVANGGEEFKIVDQGSVETSRYDILNLGFMLYQIITKTSHPAFQFEKYLEFKRRVVNGEVDLKLANDVFCNVPVVGKEFYEIAMRACFTRENGYSTISDLAADLTKECAKTDGPRDERPARSPIVASGQLEAGKYVLTAGITGWISAFFAGGLHPLALDVLMPLSFLLTVVGALFLSSGFLLRGAEASAGFYAAEFDPVAQTIIINEEVLSNIKSPVLRFLVRQLAVYPHEFFHWGAQRLDGSAGLDDVHPLGLWKRFRANSIAHWQRNKRKWESLFLESTKQTAGAMLVRRVNGEWCVLLGVRRGVSQYDGYYAFPGGKVDHARKLDAHTKWTIGKLKDVGLVGKHESVAGERETMLEAAVRELMEETGIKVSINSVAARVVNTKLAEDGRFVSFWVFVDESTKEPESNENLSNFVWLPLRVLSMEKNKESVVKWIREKTQNENVNLLIGENVLRQLHELNRPSGNERLTITLQALFYAFGVGSVVLGGLGHGILALISLSLFVIIAIGSTLRVKFDRNKLGGGTTTAAASMPWLEDLVVNGSIWLHGRLASVPEISRAQYRLNVAWWLENLLSFGVAGLIGLVLKSAGVPLDLGQFTYAAAWGVFLAGHLRAPPNRFVPAVIVSAINLSLLILPEPLRVPLSFLAHWTINQIDSLLKEKTFLTVAPYGMAWVRRTASGFLNGLFGPIMVGSASERWSRLTVESQNEKFLPLLVEQVLERLGAAPALKVEEVKGNVLTETAGVLPVINLFYRERHILMMGGELQASPGAALCGGLLHENAAVRAAAQEALLQDVEDARWTLEFDLLGMISLGPRFWLAAVVNATSRILRRSTGVLLAKAQSAFPALSGRVSLGEARTLPVQIFTSFRVRQAFQSLFSSVESAVSGKSCAALIALGGEEFIRANDEGEAMLTHAAVNLIRMQADRIRREEREGNRPAGLTITFDSRELGGDREKVAAELTEKLELRDLAHKGLLAYHDIAEESPARILEDISRNLSAPVLVFCAGSRASIWQALAGGMISLAVVNRILDVGATVSVSGAAAEWLKQAFPDQFGSVAGTVLTLSGRSAQMAPLKEMWEAAKLIEVQA